MEKHEPIGKYQVRDDNEIESIKECNGKKYALLSENGRSSYWLYLFQGEMMKRLMHFDCEKGTILALDTNEEGDLLLYDNAPNENQFNISRIPALIKNV